MVLFLLVGCADSALEERVTKLEAEQAQHGIEQAELLEENAALKKRIEVIETRRPSRRTYEPQPPAPMDGVRVVSEKEAIVERETLENFAENGGSAGRAIPHRDMNGEIDGYRVSGIRRNTLPNAIGVKNGDIVHGLNGISATSMHGAMKAYAAARSSDELVFDLTRRGEETTLTVRIVDELPRLEEANGKAD